MGGWGGGGCVGMGVGAWVGEVGGMVWGVGGGVVYILCACCPVKQDLQVQHSWQRSW